MKVPVVCAFCSNISSKEARTVNRARANNLPLYCNRTCAGLARRKGKTELQRKSEKAIYDKGYRAKLEAEIKARKAEHYRLHHDRAKEKAYRQASKQQHLEYCRTPEYRASKREYDKVYRAKKDYGELWECAILVNQIRDKALELAGGDYEIRLANGTLSKNQKRKRAYERLNREDFEDGSLGDLERHQRR